jgi:F-box-like
VLLQVANVLHSLPEEICLRILMMLQPTNIISAMLASKAFATIGRSASLWQHLLAPLRFDPVTLPLWVTRASVVKPFSYPFRKVYVTWFLPSSIVELSHIHTLNLSSTDISEVPFHGTGGTEFIQLFSKLSSLRELYLPTNALSFTTLIPHDFSFQALSSLTRLEAEDTGFSTIHAHCLRSCKNLLHLNIAKNKVRFEVSQWTARTFPSLQVNDDLTTYLPQSLSNLTHLDMCDSEYLNANDIIDFVSNLPNLHTLRVSHPDDACTPNLTQLSCLTKLKVLDIAGFDLGGNGEYDLCALSSLTSINLKGACLTDHESWECMWANTNLVSINVSQTTGFRQLLDVVEKFQECTQLQELHVGGMLDLEYGVPQMLPFLENIRVSSMNHTLVTLNMAYSRVNILTSHTDIIRDFVALRSITLDGNRTTQSAWGTLCMCTKLKDLSVVDCGIKNTWCHQLTNMVNLESIALECNDIEPFTMVPVVELLSQLCVVSMDYDRSINAGDDERKLLRILSLRN